MKVILQQDVKGQGKKGQMIEASDGYARNFLLPRKLAVPATAENVNTMKMQEKAKKAQEAAEKAEAEATAAKLKELTVKVVAKGGNGGRLFGAVTSKEIADALQAQHGIAIPKTKIVQDEPIKAFGGYELKVKLGYEVIGGRTGRCALFHAGRQGAGVRGHRHPQGGRGRGLNREREGKEAVPVYAQPVCPG